MIGHLVSESFQISDSIYLENKLPMTQPTSGPGARIQRFLDNPKNDVIMPID
jgi:ABC-type branched-subunit amino acid transport system substrate-binding protein